MPIRLAPLDVSGAVVGSQFTLSWDTSGPMGVYLPSTQQQPPSKLFVWNESGCAFDVDIPGKLYSSYLPAGGWRALYLPNDAQSMNLTVTEVIAGTLLSTLHAVYYSPNETVESDVGILGNSPAGIGGLAGGQQARVVSVPIAPIPLLQRGTTLTTGQDISLRTDGFSGGITNKAGRQFCLMYLYWFRMRADLPAAGTIVTADVSLFGDLMNGASTVASVELHSAYIASEQTAGSAFSTVIADEFCPAEALQNGVSGFALPVTGVQWRLHVNAAGNNPAVRWSIGVGVDITNWFGPGTHGNFTVNNGIF